MTLVELNSSELDRIISALHMHKQGVLNEHSPLPEMTENIADGIQYLIDKLEGSLDEARKEEENKK